MFLWPPTTCSPIPLLIPSTWINEYVFLKVSKNVKSKDIQVSSIQSKIWQLDGILIPLCFVLIIDIFLNYVPVGGGWVGVDLDMWVQCPQESEEGVGVTGVSEPPYLDVGNSTLVSWKSSKCFNLLSHLFSSCPWYFILPIQQICLMHKILI